ncbi:ferric iron uptake ABC transporter (FeT) family, periplasmic iron-binding protein [Hyphomonas neptunium ATCC 15444]|uniref:Ferric iron uptake ABC transporter (FeT) family, periplasmic iron-binding protein n=2 Tax=Hyphomonas TaxID=85 RepID=Q0BYS0_HYPNA|nr:MULTISPECIES: extracellular solute-binding protein [Hyphomonas]ABI76359.1 ferric iron uptake ABC transporter (FeT) family, periplasmic iron-binding protein [Hyphomonas neptunium ATCC 15444]KCZ91500.1 iron ABC transporter substrate-binding protein [Hyphomonas hirschiana VP5]
MKRILAVAGPVLGLALGLAACGNPAPPAATPEAPVAPAEEAPAPAGAAGTINVYSARHYDSDKAMYAAFEAETGIRVNVRESGAPELLETMRAEGERSPADVIIASDAGALYRFQDAGFTQGVTSDKLSAVIPETLREKDGNWFGLAKRARIIVYDPQVVSADEVDTYADLADARLKGEVCVRSSTNIYNLSLMGEIIGRSGAEAAAAWAEGVVANMARDPQGGDTAQIDAVAAGECAVALVNHYYWVRLAAGSPEDRLKTNRTQLSFPDQEGNGTHVNVTAAAVAAHSKSPELAIQFIEYLATPHGQELLTAETKEFPVVSGAAVPAGLEQIPGFKESDFPLSELGTHQPEAQAIFDRAGWN